MARSSCHCHKPQQLKDLLLDENIPEADFSRPSRKFYNAMLIEAFHRGRKSAPIAGCRHNWESHISSDPTAAGMHVESFEACPKCGAIR